MSIGSKLMENKGLLLVSVFYLIAGILDFVALFLSTFPPQLAIIGILSLATAYGLMQKRMWAFWLAIVTFLVTTTFAVYTLAYTLGNLMLNLAMVAYLILTWIVTAYAAMKRKTLQS